MGRRQGVSSTFEGKRRVLFTATEYEGELPEQDMKDCSEGELVWVSKKEIENLRLWEGDKIFLRLLDERKEFFSLKLRYEGEKLVETVLYED